MSDVMRFLTLYKFGGIYCDLDIVAMKSFGQLSNFTARESEKWVAAGYIGEFF